MHQASSNETLEQKSGQAKGLNELESVIARAMSKTGAKKSTDLCHYLPGDAGGYMHHFTMEKMRRKAPDQLRTLIQQFILTSDRPSPLPPKQRAPRGSRANKSCDLTRGQIEKMFQLARNSKNREMLLLLSSKRSLKSCKRDLIQSIRRGDVDQMLWDAYVEACRVAKAGPLVEEAAFFLPDSE